jgi:hypothetical protein
MDNGLIFPYPWLCAHAEPTDTKTSKPAFLLFGVGVGGVVGLRWW